MITTIVFDAGGVILKIDKLLDSFARLFKVNRKDLWEAINKEGYHLFNGKISELVFWKRVTKNLKINFSDRDLKNLWIKDFERLVDTNKEVIKIIRKLGKNYNLGLITNTIPSHVKVMKKRKLFDYFDVVIASCEEKISKPNKKIFKLFLRKASKEANECIFIDDRKENVKAAKEVGMKGLLYEDVSKLKKDLERLKINFRK